MKDVTKTDEKFMRMAMKEAIRGGYTVFPNPRVGAVIVSNDEVLSKGHHQFFGGPHAEAYALREISEDVRDAVLYVTLEPCSFSGKTPPCTDLITPRMISRVVIGSLDPNPRINGKGVEILEARGIDTLVGVLENEVRLLNREFFTYIEKKRPYVIIKYAVTMDGYIAKAAGESTLITGEASRRSVHELRARCDAILVGRKTVEIDDPDLSSHGVGNDPQIVVLGNKKKLGKGLRIFSRKPIFFCSSNDDYDFDFFPLMGDLPHENIASLMSELYDKEIKLLMVEGGGDTITSFLESGFFDEIHAYIAPKVFGDGVPLFSQGLSTEGWNLKIESLDQFDNDVRIIYRSD